MILKKINDWAYQWKMNFNPDPSKQAQEIIFSRKVQENFHPPLYFNNIKVEQTALQKHLGIFLDPKLDFKEHLKNMSVKVNKSTAFLRKLQSILQSILHIIILFIKTWKHFNIMLTLQLLVV